MNDDRARQIAAWELDADRPRLEVLARFLLEIQRRQLRPTPILFARWWRRKRREVRLTSRAFDALLKAVWVFPIEEALTSRFPLVELFQ